MLAKLIQQKLKAGMKVNFILSTGKEIAGLIVRIESSRVVIKSQEREKKRLAVNIQAIAAWEILSEEEEEQLFEDLIKLPEKAKQNLDNLKYDTVVETEEFEWKQLLAESDKKKRGFRRGNPRQTKRSFTPPQVPSENKALIFIILGIIALGTLLYFTVFSS